MRIRAVIALALALCAAPSFAYWQSRLQVSTASAAVAISNTANSTDTTAGATFTETAVNFGTASAGRCIAVAFGTRSNSAGITISSVTIGGVTASNVNTQSQAGGGTDTAAMYVAAVPTGTSGNIVITFSASMLRLGYSVWAITGAGSCTPTANNGATAAGTTSLSTTINVNANGAAIAANGSGGITGGSATTTWTGVTKDYDVLIGATVQGFSSGHALYALAQTPLTVTAQPSVSSNVQLVAGAWGP